MTIQLQPVQTPFEPATLTISELANWRQREEGSRRLLPPIQSSMVWSNDQIVNYWDSLLRGYPAGMMKVHRIEKGARGASSRGRDSDGTTCPANEDYMTTSRHNAQALS